MTTRSLDRLALQGIRLREAGRLPDEQGIVQHAQLTFGNGMIMLGLDREPRARG